MRSSSTVSGDIDFRIKNSSFPAITARSSDSSRTLPATSASNCSAIPMRKSLVHNFRIISDTWDSQSGTLRTHRMRSLPVTVVRVHQFPLKAPSANRRRGNSGIPPKTHEMLLYLPRRCHLQTDSILHSSRHSPSIVFADGCSGLRDEPS